MTAVDIARNWHESHVVGKPFTQLLADYLRGGYVWSSPEAFLLAQPVSVDIKNLEVRSGKHQPNAWFVELAAGDKPFEQFLRVMPYELPYLAWARRDHLRVWKLEQFRNKIYGRH